MNLPLQQLTNRRIIQKWLYVILLLCIAIVLVGGATRLTGSGLSITEWKPIHGMIPPIGIEQWNEEFLKYQQIAQYKFVNEGMNLVQFKQIFWWEWAHRVLARIVGLIAFFGFVWFWISKRIEKQFLLKLFTVPILIGIQGAIGWWMVSSGIGSELTSVSQYRLAIHLVTACLVIVFVTYIAGGLGEYSQAPARRSMQYFAAFLVFMILFQIYLGALVAGLHAGKIYNTWPLMDGQLIPDGLFADKPLWLNFFENTLTVQFFHRMFAYMVLLVALAHNLKVAQLEPETTHARRAVLLVLLILIQAIFGIVTLLLAVPLGWGVLHQIFALFVLCFSVAHWRAMIGSYPN